MFIQLTTRDLFIFNFFFVATVSIEQWEKGEYIISDGLHNSEKEIWTSASLANRRRAFICPATAAAGGGRR
jgi:hypothetical protein